MVAVLCVLGALVVILLVLGRTRRARVYFIAPFGFMASPGPASRFHEVDRDTLSRVTDRLLANDLFDMLQVGRSPDEYGGVMVCLRDGVLELTKSFNIHEYQLASFLEAMSAAGFEGVQDSDGYNGGFTEKHRLTTVTYVLPHSTPTILKAIDAALANLEPGVRTTYFVSGSSFDLDGLRWGITIGRSGDPIEEILAPPVDI